MDEVNKFYSVYKLKADKQEFQIRDLGDEMYRTSTVAFSDGNGRFSGGDPIHTPTTAKDYDKLFVKELLAIDTPYKIEEFLSFHYGEYHKRSATDPKLFLKHMRFVVLVDIKRIKKEAYVALMTKWIEKQEEILARESSRQEGNSEGFTKEDILVINQKLDELLKRFAKLEVGQQITYDDLAEEIKELKELSRKLSKKNWFEILQGKLVTIGLGKLSDEVIKLLESTFENKNLLP